MSINIHNAEFIISAVKSSQFPDDALPEIVFVGRSNVGKSSILNALLNRKNLAYVGNTPGKTRERTNGKNQQNYRFLFANAKKYRLSCYVG